MARRYVPRRGDIVWLHFEQTAGHEQAGRRPALVLSPRRYNARVGLALFCPLTSHIKGYPFEVLLPSRLNVQGAILSDQVKSLDWRARDAKWLCSVPSEILKETVARLLALVDPEEAR